MCIHCTYVYIQFMCMCIHCTCVHVCVCVCALVYIDINSQIEMYQLFLLTTQISEKQCTMQRAYIGAEGHY